MFGNKHARALRDAKAFAACIAQTGLPYALELNNVLVASSDHGKILLERWQAENDLDGFITWFDSDGYDHRYMVKRIPVQQKTFNALLTLFIDATQQQKSYDHFEMQVKHLEADKRVFSEVLDNFTFPVWVQGRNHQIYYANKKYDELFEKGMPQSIRTVIQDGLMKRTGFFVHTTAAVVLGERRQYEVKVQPLSPDRALVWTADRTEMMEEIGARARLLSAQKTLFEQLHTAVAMFDEKHMLNFYNSAYARLWDFDEAYLNTKPKLGDILERLRTARYLPEQADFKSFKNDILDRFTSLLGPLEEMLYLPDGRTLRLLTIPNPSGGLLVTFEDVTSTLQLESSVNTLLAVQRETLENMTEAVAVFGGDGRLQLWNPQYAQLWGLYPERLQGIPHITSLIDKMVERFTLGEQENFKQKLIGHTLNRRSENGRLVFNDGRQVNFMAVPLPDGATLLAYDDVTDAVKVEQALRDKAEALEAAEQLKLDFLANVSYQLRTPLSAITGFAELLEHQYFGQLNEKQMEYAKGITEAGQNLLSLIDDILDLSTIEAGYMEMSKDKIDVRAMVSGIYHLTEEWARKGQHVFVLEIEDKIAPVTGDERRLKQALLNLIRNAIAFTPRGGTITVGARQDGANIVMFVKDTGIGIAPEDQTRIFKNFARVENNSLQQNAGAGLGLSLVKSIVELNKGTLKLDSAPGKGTEISLIMPAAQA